MVSFKVADLDARQKTAWQAGMHQLDLTAYTGWAVYLPVVLR